jgi:dipeptidyl aminopeptidase/acylaminoacyl peptidase
MSKPKIAAETVALIKEMARDNRLWGAERIRGEFLKLGLHVCKRQVWNATTGRRRLSYAGHADDVASLAWSPDGERIASGAGDVFVWQAA